MKRTVITLVAAALVSLGVTTIVGQAAPQERAKPKLTPARCIDYARTDNRITGRAMLKARQACARTADIDACLAVPGSNMSLTVCTALVDAIRKNAVPKAWAWSPALHELLRRESTWNPNAVNEDSGACGLFQRLPCPWSYHGGNAGPSDDWVRATPLQQARNGLGYITGRYGTPDAALAFHNANGWY